MKDLRYRDKMGLSTFKYDMRYVLCLHNYIKHSFSKTTVQTKMLNKHSIDISSFILITHCNISFNLIDN